MNKDSKILIVGHDDIIENSLRSYLQADGYINVFSSSQIGLNPAIQSSVYAFFQKHKPEYVFLASTRSGGIKANEENGAEFMYHNLESQNNVLYASWKFGVKKLLYFAGSCIYPKECPQPMKPEYLLTGELEKTSEPYSLAKIAGVKLCQAFKKQYGLKTVVMVPATVYGPGGNEDMETAHVMGALIGKFAEGVQGKQSQVTVWGTGNPRREFIYAGDFAQAAVYLMDRYDGQEIMHAGSGSDVSVKDLAEMIAHAVGFTESIVFDTTKPDGAMKKLLDSGAITALGWKPRVELEDGIKKTCAWYLDKSHKGAE